MSENVLIREENAAEEVKQVAGLYPLDWQTTKVKIGKGRFEHTFRRPTAEELLERDRESQTPIEVAKDGSYKLPDPTADEEINAKIYDKLLLDVQGYESRDAVPAAHKSAAFQGLYKREFWIDEDSSPFDEEVTVFEEIGEKPDFTVSHVFRQPEESELKKYRSRMQTGEFKPAKRGRQHFVTRSTLKTAMDFYDMWIKRVEGATVNGLEWGANTNGINQAFIDQVDPLIKRMAVKEFADHLIEALLD